MRSLRYAGAVLALLLVASSVVSAQARGAAAQRSSGGAKPLEIGTDAGFSLGMDDPSTTSLAIPIGNVRVGVHVSDVLSIEPTGQINYFKLEGFDASTSWMFGVGGLYHFSADRTKSQLYIRPFVTIDGQSNVDSEIGVGVGAGMKLRPRMNGRLQWRTEANIFSRADQMFLNFLFGVSLWPR